MRGREVVGKRDQGILEGGEVFGAFSPVAVLLKLALGRGARIRDELPHALDECGAKRRGLPRMDARKLGGLAPEQIEVEIGCLFRGGLIHGGSPKFSTFKFGTWAAQGSPARSALRR